ncbi:MAG: hypothetical protein O3B24_06395, partial [Verrucomicrobia bacterium]|nr:hypothetical protein [Verrucomicrobiota bacterium]
MNRRILQRSGALAILLVLALIVFLSWITSGESLWGPDNFPHAIIERSAELPGSLTGSWSSMMLGGGYPASPLTPVILLQTFLPPLFFHTFSYLFSVFLLVAATYYFVRGRGMRDFPAACAALALGFTPHTFSLIAAGHLGKFNMMPMAVFMLACLDRGIERKSLLHFAWAGLAAAWALGAQADIMLIFAGLGASYGLYRLVMCWPRTGVARYLGINAAGVAVAGACAFGMGWAALSGTLNETIKARADVMGKTAEEKWIFATNWSLPPEEMLEFVAPCFFGVGSGDPAGPYWGRVGRTVGWREHRQGLMSLRQNTEYLGALPLSLSVFALVWAIAGTLERRRRNRRGMSAGDEDGGTASLERDEVSDGAEHRTSNIENRTTCPPKQAQREGGQVVRFSSGSDAHLRALRLDTYFWWGVLIVSFVLALGRYTPFYRLFYMLPYASSMRAPVKFLHVAEIALGILTAIGLTAALDYAWRKPAPAKKRVKQTFPLYHGMALSSGIMAGLMILGMLLAGAARARLAVYWTELGLESQAALLQRNMLLALLQGAVWFGVAGFAYWIIPRSPQSGFVTRWLPIILLISLAVDRGLVDRRYVRTVDLSAFLDSNPMIERLKQESTPYRVSCPFSQSPFSQWREFMFRAHLIDALEPPQARVMPDDYTAYFGALQPVMPRLWQLANVRFIIGPLAPFEQLLKNGMVTLDTTYDMDRKGRILAVAPGAQGQIGLFRFPAEMPRAVVVHDWVSMPDETEILKRLTSSGWNPAQRLILTGEGDHHQSLTPPTAVQSIRHT